LASLFCKEDLYLPVPFTSSSFTVTTPHPSLGTANDSAVAAAATAAATATASTSPPALNSTSSSQISKSQWIRSKTFGTSETSNGVINILNGEHSSPILTIDISPDNKYIASAGEDMQILIWDALIGDVSARLAGHSSAVHSVSFSADFASMPGAEVAPTGLSTADNAAIACRRLVSAAFDGTIRIWDVLMGTLLLTISDANAYNANLAISEKTLSSDEKYSSVMFGFDNTKIVCGSYDHHIIIFDLTSLVESSVVIAVDSNAPKPAGGGGREVWSLDTKVSYHLLEGHSDKVTSVAFSPNRQYIASASYDKR
jgi:WD40 repeat protein